MCQFIVICLNETFSVILLKLCNHTSDERLVACSGIISTLALNCSQFGLTPSEAGRGKKEKVLSLW